MGSTRRPGKALAEVTGKSHMERVLDRLERIFDGPRVMAIPDLERDDVLEAMGRRRGWDVFRGSEPDVLGRFAGAARRFGITKLVRICGDNPLVDGRAVAGIVEALRTHASARTQGYPLGAGAEGCTAEALLAADAEAVEPHDREHVMPFIYRHVERFPFALVSAPPLSSQPRLTVDTEEDLDRFRRIFAALGDDPALEDVIAFLEREG